LHVHYGRTDLPWHHINDHSGKKGRKHFRPRSFSQSYNRQCLRWSRKEVRTTKFGVKWDLRGARIIRFLIVIPQKQASFFNFKKRDGSKCEKADIRPILIKEDLPFCQKHAREDDDERVKEVWSSQCVLWCLYSDMHLF